MLTILTVYGQVNCAQKLKEAQKMYEQGRLEDIPEMLKSCIPLGYSKVELIQAYKLIILAYLFLDEHKEAEHYMALILSLDPYYYPDRSLDPIEYIELFEHYRMVPYISFGAGIGLIETFPRVLPSAATQTTFIPRSSLQVGLCMDVAIYKKVFLTVEANYANKRYFARQPILETSALRYAETQHYVDIPLSLKIIKGSQQFKYYARFGMTTHYLLSSKANIVRFTGTFVENQGDNIDLKEIRQDLTVSPLIGAGVQLKLGYGFLFLEGRYVHGIGNIAQAENRQNFIAAQLSNYGYTQTDFTLSTIHVAAGYMYSLYRVRQIKVIRE